MKESKISRTTVAIFATLIITVLLTVFNSYRLNNLTSEMEAVNGQITINVPSDSTILKIGKDDFEKLIDRTVKDQWIFEMSATFKNFGIITSVIIAFLGFFGIKGADRFIRETVDRIAKKELHEEIDEVQKEVILLRDEIELRAEIDAAMELGKGESRTSKEKYNMVFEKLVTGFEKIANSPKKELLTILIDNFFSFVYSSRRDNDMNRLAELYRDRVEFSYLTWARIALANMNLYELDGAKEFKEKALYAADRSLEKLPGYGTANSVYLIIFMIDLKAGKDVDHDVVKKFLKEINSGSSRLVSYETMNYLKGLTSFWADFVKLLEDNYPEEMKLMTDRWYEYSRRIK